MATKKIVPRANGEGALGDNTVGIEKYWGGVYTNVLNSANAIEMAAFNDSLQLKRSTAYVTGQIRFVSGLQAGLYLEATVDGTTDSTDITIPSTVVPNTTTITDGTVTWIVRQLANTGSLSQAGERQKSTAYDVSNMASFPTLPYGWYLEATTGGTTSASDLVITSPSVGDTITDGTVTWTIRAVASTADIPAPVDISGKANVDLDNLSAAGLALIQQRGGGIIAGNLAANGYVKFENGFIMQWGTVQSTPNFQTITFPISFAVDSFVVIGGELNANTSGYPGWETNTIQIVSHDKSQFVAGIYNQSSNKSYMWVAIGK